MTGASHVRIRPAVANDVPTVLAIITEASEWRLAHGYANPWPLPTPEAPYREALGRGELVVCEDPTGRVVGTMILQWDDPGIWGVRPPDAGYVHKLAVRRDYAGHNAGGAMLEWAAEQTRQQGRRWLRLDTHSTHHRLHRYYEEQGFRRVGELRKGDVPLTLFERDLGPTAPAG
jgi:GNAT superfamily N-acetyltransferase